jgi:CheY-like chemotaxis protein
MAPAGTIQSEKGKLLFLEDKEFIVDDFHKLIRKAGYDFLSTSDAEEALLVAEFEKPDAILLDIAVHVPENSDTIPGYDFFSALRKNPKTKDIPVIILTDSSSEDDRKKCERAGAAAYLTRRGQAPEKAMKVMEAVISKARDTD